MGQFRKFVADGGYVTDGEKGEKKGARGFNTTTGKFAFNSGYSWRKVGFKQTTSTP